MKSRRTKSEIRIYNFEFCLRLETKKDSGYGSQGILKVNKVIVNLLFLNQKKYIKSR